MGLQEAYLAKIEAELKEWDAEIMQHEAKAERAQAQIQIQYFEQLAALRTQHTTARDKLHELKQASGSAWESVKLGVESAWHELRSGLTSIAAKFK